MNIFVLDLDPATCAKYHTNIHLGSQSKEASQLLAGAHWRLNPTAHKVEGLPKPTHMNHPCAVWVRESRDNYLWLLDLYHCLHAEWMHRFGKVHGNYTLRVDSINQPPPLLESIGMTPFALAMDDRFKIQGDPVASYRNYYKHGKQHLHKWTRRNKPEWI